MNTLTLNSYAKVNLYLQVLKKRKDNYHSLRTLFEKIDLSDTILLTSRPDTKITIRCNDPQVPKDHSNLCYRSAALLQKCGKVRSGVDITLIKRIPVSAGLGGGSSNAATVLVGLNRLWKLKYSREKLAGYARNLGSDVPFFVYDARFALGAGRGDLITPLRLSPKVKLWHVLVVPRIAVSTPLIFKKWDEYIKQAPGLTTSSSDVKLSIQALRKRHLSLLSGLLFNSLERITLKLYPEVKRIKGALTHLGVKTILMSGSGPAVFGVVSGRKEAQALRSRLHAQERSWRVFVTRTV